MTFDRDEGSLRFFHGNGKRIKEFEGLPFRMGLWGFMCAMQVNPSTVADAKCALC